MQMEYGATMPDNCENTIDRIAERFPIEGSNAVAPHDGGVLCFLPIYPAAGSSFMLFVENGLDEGAVKITDYSSCHENAFHFCNAAQERELKALVSSKSHGALRMKELPDGSWSLFASLDEGYSLEDLDLVLDIFDTVFSATDTFLSETIFSKINTAR